MFTSNEVPHDAGMRRLALVLALLLFWPTASAAAGTGDVPEPAVQERLVVERTPLQSGAEIVTIFGSTDGGADTPIVAILDDTLGDDDPANDQLRYVWVFTYCPPSLKQKVLACIPFNYVRASTRVAKEGSVPPVIHDFSKYRRSAWRSLAFYGAQLAFIDPAGLLFRAGSRTYLRNEDAYRGAHLENALSVIESVRSQPDATEFHERSTDASLGQFVMRGKVGAFLNAEHLGDAARAHASTSRKNVGRNWELLRQRAEEEGLFFEPIASTSLLPAHAIVWVSADDVARSPRNREFHSRFLNMASPWSDNRLRQWEGYTRKYYVEPSGRYSVEPAAGSTAVEMIPLAVYGLDFSRIPALLVDFRSFFNPRSREVSGRALDDIGQYMLDATPFGDAKYFLLKRFWGTFSRRKGIDISQPTRATAYAQLATLVSLEAALDPELNRIVGESLDKLRTNPLQSRWDSERSAARTQYESLMAAARSGVIDRRLERDRETERLRIEHGILGRSIRKIATVATFGLYRPKADSLETRERYALTRAMKTHVALLEEVAATPRPIDVAWAPEKYRASLDFVVAHGDLAPDSLSAALAVIVRGTEDVETQILALEGLAGINDGAARDLLAQLGAGVPAIPVTPQKSGLPAPVDRGWPESAAPQPAAP